MRTGRGIIRTCLRGRLSGRGICRWGIWRLGQLLMGGNLGLRSGSGLTGRSRGTRRLVIFLLVRVLRLMDGRLSRRIWISLRLLHRMLLSRWCRNYASTSVDEHSSHLPLIRVHVRLPPLSEDDFVRIAEESLATSPMRRNICIQVAPKLSDFKLSNAFMQSSSFLAAPFKYHSLAFSRLGLTPTPF